MPRYFFDIDDGDREARDEEGVELDSPADARESAIGILPDIASNVVVPVGDRRDIVVNVREEGGRVIFWAKLALTAEWVVG